VRFHCAPGTESLRMDYRIPQQLDQLGRRSRLVVATSTAETKVGGLLKVCPECSSCDMSVLVNVDGLTSASRSKHDLPCGFAQRQYAESLANTRSIWYTARHWTSNLYSSRRSHCKNDDHEQSGGVCTRILIWPERTVSAVFTPMANNRSCNFRYLALCLIVRFYQSDRHFSNCAPQWGVRYSERRICVMAEEFYWRS
jgi:hypothetical protein